MLDLLAHHFGFSREPLEGVLLNDGPQAGWVLPGQNLLALYPRIDGALDVLRVAPQTDAVLDGLHRLEAVA